MTTFIGQELIDHLEGNLPINKYWSDGNEQEIYTGEPFNPSYLQGLMQTDGCFTFSWEADKTLKPKILISFGQKRFKIAEALKNY